MSRRITRTTIIITVLTVFLIGGRANSQQNLKREAIGNVAPPPGMVFIPGGEFPLGSAVGEDDEGPIHWITVTPCFVDKYEITNKMFKEFINANPQWSKENILPKYHDGDYLKLWRKGCYPPELENHPVVYVSWYAAIAYARWAGKRLPTEAEWEKAACYNLLNGKMTTEHKFRWAFGDRFYPQLANTAHYHGLPIGGFWGEWWGNFSINLTNKLLKGQATTPIGHFQAGCNNLYDMTGNVWEWCHDWYKGDSYKKQAIIIEREKKDKLALKTKKDVGDKFAFLHEAEPVTIENPIDLELPSENEAYRAYRVVRGGAWLDNAVTTRAANRYRFRPNFTSDDIGLRCAKSATAKKKIR